MAEIDRRYYISQQVWGILALAAIEKRTVTYEEVGKKIGQIPLNVSRFLSPIKEYCKYHDLPHLNALCVSKGKDGLPQDPEYGDDSAELLKAALEFDWSKYAASPRDIAIAHELYELKNKTKTSATG